MVRHSPNWKVKVFFFCLRLSFFELFIFLWYHSVHLILLLVPSLLIQLIAIFYDALFYRRYIYHGNLGAIIMSTLACSGIAANATLTRAKRSWCCLWVVSVLLNLLRGTIQLFILVIREQRNLFSFFPERTLWLRYLLCCNFFTWRKWILVTLTGRHVLLEDFWRATRCFLHH